MKADEVSSLPEFAKLHDIITVQDSSDVIFVVSLLRTIRFDQKFGAYEVEPIHEAYACFYVVSLKCHYLFNCILKYC